MKAEARLKQADLKPSLLAAGKAADYFELTKPRISAMVIVTTIAGFYMASSGPLDWALLLNALGATALVGSGASALNQAMEREHDAKMPRTSRRPLPAGRLQLAEAVAFGAGLAIGGTVWMLAAVNWVAAAVAASSCLLYVAIYTPLKRLTHLNTIVGAVPGALPPLIGWAAAQGALPWPAWTIFAILFFWQLPHFFAIAWLYREDYEAGGFKMISVGDPTGARLGLRIIGHTLALLVASLTPTLWGLTTRAYFFAALVLGGVFLAYGIALALHRSKTNARRLLLVSVIYLPLIFAAMMAFKG